MKRRQVTGLLLAGMTVGLFAPAARADGMKVTVEAWDNGADMAMSTDYGMGGSGDPAKATMGFKVSTDTVKAGEVNFELINSSKDMEHEMIVIPLAEGAKLPYVEAEKRIDEDAAGAIGEIEETEPGQHGNATFNLKAGKYLLVCNIPGHYLSGMWAVLTVE
jgi:uncharacterized cupredoxin-like copper-binding protein